jgi:hypothetical protein
MALKGKEVSDFELRCVCERVLGGWESHGSLVGHKNGKFFPAPPVPVIGTISGRVVSLNHSRKSLSSKLKRALKNQFLLESLFNSAQFVISNVDNLSHPPQP